jgi:hypothetical protein
MGILGEWAVLIKIGSYEELGSEGEERGGGFAGALSACLGGDQGCKESL